MSARQTSLPEWTIECDLCGEKETRTSLKPAVKGPLRIPFNLALPVPEAERKPGRLCVDNTPCDHYYYDDGELMLPMRSYDLCVRCAERVSGMLSKMSRAEKRTKND